MKLSQLAPSTLYFLWIANSQVQATGLRGITGGNEEQRTLQESSFVELQDVTQYTINETGQTYDILCYKPTTCTFAECPLFVWTDGTTQNAIRNVPDKSILEEMVDRGYVACVAQYDDRLSSYENCPTSKTQNIFDPNINGSLTNQICDTHADCTLGLVVNGFSQGAHIAALAAQFVTVNKALLYGNGVLGDDTCMINNNQILPEEKRRSIVGSNDSIFNTPSVAQQQKDTSGYDCGENENCLQPDGSGYYIVPGRGHIFFLQGFFLNQFYTEFADPDSVFGLKQNLDWLVS